MSIADRLTPAERQLNHAFGVLEDAWTQARHSPFIQRQLGTLTSRLPDLSYAAAERRAAVGKSLLQRLSAVDTAALPADLSLTLRVVGFRARTWAKEADWYWRVIDPLSIGMFGMFLPTAYCGGWLLGPLHGQFASFTFQEAGDVDRYLALVSDYARLIDQFTERTAGQAERGMRMPKVQVAQARTLLHHLKSGALKTLGVSAERIAATSSRAVGAEITARVLQQVEPALERSIQGLSDDYLARAPDQVGLGQYPGGPELYAELVKLHTTLELSPEDVHALGHERIAQIETRMRAIRDELHFSGDPAAFLRHLDQDPRWRANTVEGVQATFQRYIERVTARYGECFGFPPGADYGVAPLPPALESSMTYGYYDPPRPDHATGLFMFNARNLTRQTLVSLGSLTFHELVPGHHLHFSTQQKNDTLHPFRRYSFVNAFNEGWAEYAATLAGEMGLYEAPEERYGRLLNDAFLTCRLVVDTGMNALGWSLERAREYMRQHSGMSEAEVVTDSIRYACDIPGQALAYKLGDTHILKLRERMRTALGTRFSLVDFHSAVLSAGCLPMPELEWHIEQQIARRLSPATH